MSTKEKAGASAADTATTGGAMVPSPTGGSALTQVPANLLEQFEGAAGQGLQNVKREDVALPFLGLLQDLSPQVKRSEPQFIEGAQAGMFMDSIAKQPLDGAIGILVVPLLFDKVYNVWRKRINGGGFFGSHKTLEAAQARVAELAKADGKDKVPSEHLDITDTALHYVLYQVPGTGQWRQALLSCKSTMLKKSRAWNHVMQSLEVPRAKGGSFTPPSWGTMYHLTSVIERKDQNSWFNFDVEYNGLVTDAELFEKAKSAYKALVAGEGPKVDFNRDDISGGGAEAAAESVGATSTAKNTF